MMPLLRKFTEKDCIERGSSVFIRNLIYDATDIHSPLHTRQDIHLSPACLGSIIESPKRIQAFISHLLLLHQKKSHVIKKIQAMNQEEYNQFLTERLFNLAALARDCFILPLL